jgi:transposase
MRGSGWRRKLDANWKKQPPTEIKKLRDAHLRPHVDAFFAWVEQQRPVFSDERGLVRTALVKRIRDD